MDQIGIYPAALEDIDTPRQNESTYPLMGNRYTSVQGKEYFALSESMAFLGNIPDVVVNADRVGRVYMLVHNSGIQENTSATDSLLSLDVKRAHHSILIDVAGASDHHMLRGVNFHLTAVVPTRKTQFRAFSEPIQCSSLITYFRPTPCRIHPTNDVEGPKHWAFILKYQAEKVYNSMTQCESLPWSGTVNCQQYVRKMIEHFQLQLPEGVLLAGDVLPAIVDIGILIMSIKKSKEEAAKANASD